MTKQFNNVDHTGNAVKIGDAVVRIWETGEEHVVAIRGLWFNKAEATLLRDWLDNVLQAEKPVTACTHPLDKRTYQAGPQGISVNQFRCTLCGGFTTLTEGEIIMWQDRYAATACADYKPIYAHDCTECVYLGRYDVYDLYIHRKHNTQTTVIARYGNDGDYTSCPIDYVNGRPPLGEALYRAKARGLA